LTASVALLVQTISDGFGVDELGDGFARLFIGFGRFVRERVQAAMDVGVAALRARPVMASSTASGFWALAALSR
jgi:hypothetical protein